MEKSVETSTTETQSIYLSHEDIINLLVSKGVIDPKDIPGAEIRTFVEADYGVNLHNGEQTEIDAHNTVFSNLIVEVKQSSSVEHPTTKIETL